MRKAMPANERPIHQGGLMRCCLLTLAESKEQVTTVGEIIVCKFDNKTEMIVGEDEAWRWNYAE